MGDHDPEGIVIHEKSYRSFAKAISWRTVGTFDTMVISFLITGKPKFAISIGLVELITKTLLYFFHERAWNRIAFGKIKQSSQDYSI